MICLLENNGDSIKSESMPVRPRALVEPKVEVARKPGALKLQRQTPLKVESKSNLVGSKSTSIPQGIATEEVSNESPPGCPHVERFEPTRRCPACESGMNVPGVRHTKDCRKRFAEFQEQQSKERRMHEPDSFSSPPGSRHEGLVESSPGVSEHAESSPPTDDPIVSDLPLRAQEEYRMRFKRSAETATAELEKEIKESATESIQESLNFDWFWVGSSEPVLMTSLMSLEGAPSFVPATSPEMYMGDFNSIRYEPGKQHEFVKMKLGGTEVLIWRPDGIVDDQTLESLDVSQGFLGMQEEIRNLEHCKTGKVTNEAGMKKLKAENPGLRVIQSRWVCAFKTQERVRARIVVKDYNHGATAKSLGFSSPTPSIESLHLILAISATRRYRLRSLDIGHAFMHSPLNSKVIIKLPLSVSLVNGEPSYMMLDKSLNGLREGSLCWLQLLSATVETVGLWHDTIEPCVYGGEIFDDSGRSLGFALAVVYVDDILLASSTIEAEERIVSVISGVVPTKTTGQIDENGGSLSFIGRTISREPHGAEIRLSVSPSYLDSTFAEYGVVKGTENVPDIASHMERTVSSPEHQKPLSDEAYTKFQRGLGRLLWLSQVRHDLKAWLSVVGTQQSSPVHGTEMALKAILRFLLCDMHVVLCLPSRDESLDSGVTEDQMKTIHLHAFADASHGPYRFNKRRGISGGCVYFEHSLVRSLSRQQQALSLSSCEAELYSLQCVCQEAISFSKLVHRMLFSLGEAEELDPVVVWIESDSSSALQLIQSVDVPKKSRHVEIRLLWMREQLEQKRLHLRHRPGTENPSDLFTKCLSGRLFFKHRFALGLIKVDGLDSELQELQELCIVFQNQNPQGRIAFVELCCSGYSELRRACEHSQVPYVGVMANIQKPGVLNRVRICVTEWKSKRDNPFFVHVHASTPCSSGSPLKNFHAHVVSQSDQEWEEIMSVVSSFLKLGDSASFELPLRNEIWSRAETVAVLAEVGLNHDADVKLCKTGMTNADGIPVGKVLRFKSTSKWFEKFLHERFSECECPKHADLGNTSFTQTGFYNRKLARSLLSAVRAAKKKHA